MRAFPFLSDGNGGLCKPVRWTLFALVLTAALLVRVRTLGFTPLWVDEAESSINALTILQRGYPVDRYLGLPIYENTLVRRWPESEEYEFRDISYSDRGVAIYHGWLPLYSIAAAFRIAGIPPDDAGSTLRVRHDRAARMRRTLAARAPAVLFSLLSLLATYAAAKALGNTTAAWTVLLVCTFSAVHISVGQQARYYAATVAFSMLCGLMTWRMLQRGKWPDFLWGGLCFSLLFHTHLLTFLSMVLLWACCVPVMMRRHSRVLEKIAGFTLIGAVACLPWVLGTGFLDQFGIVPSARTLMSMPGDLFIYPAAKTEFGILLTGSLLLLLLLLLARKKLPEGVTARFLRHSGAMAFLYLWVLLGYLTFVFLIPAASFSLTRLGITLLGPCFLIICIFLTDVGDAFGSKYSTIISFTLGAGFLLFSNFCRPQVPAVEAARRYADLEKLFQYLQRADLPPGTKLYATPNEHLVLTFYTGLPFQSIAPVRKQFLDKWPGNILFVEKVDFSITDDSEPLHWKSLQEAGREAGFLLHEPEAGTLSNALVTHDYRSKLAAHVAQIAPPVENVPAFAQPLLMRHRRLMESRQYVMTYDRWKHPIFRGFRISSISDWWQIFFYRFVNPDAHRYSHLNYYDRIRDSRLSVISGSNWVVYHSPAGPPPPDGSRMSHAAQFASPKPLMVDQAP